jgi:hypothetical protein
MAKRPKLTIKLIQSLRTDKAGGERTYCGALAGFGVHVLPSGRKSFFLEYTAPGSRRRRWMKIGYFGDQTRAGNTYREVTGMTPQMLRTVLLSASVALALIIAAACSYSGGFVGSTNIVVHLGEKGTRIIYQRTVSGKATASPDNCAPSAPIPLYKKAMASLHRDAQLGPNEVLMDMRQDLVRRQTGNAVCRLYLVVSADVYRVHQEGQVRGTEKSRRSRLAQLKDPGDCLAMKGESRGAIKARKRAENRIQAEQRHVDEIKAWLKRPLSHDPGEVERITRWVLSVISSDPVEIENVAALPSRSIHMSSGMGSGFLMANYLS